jgi:heavy metal efflux system protein
LLTTMTLVPGLAYWAFRRPRPAFHNRPLEWLQGGYQRLLGFLLRTPVVVYVASLASLAVVVVLALSVGREFLPDLDEGALWLQVQMPTGLSLDKASEMAGELRKTLREFPEVSYVVTQLGRSDDGTDPWTPSQSRRRLGSPPTALGRTGRPRRNSSTSSPSGSTECPGSRSASASRSSTASTTRSAARIARSPCACSATTSMS